MYALDKFADRFPLPTWRRLSLVLIAVIATFVAWASQAELSQVATAPGMVVPAGQVRTVQHLEGGIVTDIAVQDGDRVVAGQRLVRLDLGAGGSNRDELQARVDGLLLERARLMAEIAGIDLTLPAEPAARRPDLARAEREAYDNRLRQLRSNLQVLDERKTQRQLDLEMIDIRLDGLQRQIELSQQQHDISSQLAESQLFPRLRSLEIEQSYEQMHLQIAELMLARPLAESAIDELAEQAHQEQIRYQREASERLRDVELELARQRELLEQADDQANRTEILSPIDGIVQNLAVNTIGGVIEPGEPILQIVPVGETLVVEAELSPTDIGHVHVGQRATVRLMTYDYFRYGGLDGTIVTISADRHVAREGNAYYLVRIELDDQALRLSADEVYPVMPGMEAEVDLHIGTRTALSYIFQPVLKVRDRAFQDR